MTRLNSTHSLRASTGTVFVDRKSQFLPTMSYTIPMTPQKSSLSALRPRWVAKSMKTVSGMVVGWLAGAPSMIAHWTWLRRLRL